METVNFGEPKANQGGNNSDAQRGRSSDQKRRRKLIWGGIILAVLILAVIGWQYWQYLNSPYYQQMKAVKILEKMAKESDKWGGKTPEETIALFTDAVKKGDFELASKYGNSEKIKSKLELLKTDGKINLLISGLEKGELEENPGFGGNSFDLRVKDGGKKYWVIGLFKSDGGTWKIAEF